MLVPRTVAIFIAMLASSLPLASLARAQMLGAPVLQNAFVNPGITAGVDFGAGDNLKSFGGAVAWSPLSGKYQLSGGAAYLDPKGGSGTATYGARLMVPVYGGSSAFGVAPFVGMGGTNLNGVNDWQIPLGVSAGYRRALSNGRGVSAFVAPFYSWARARENGVTQTHGLFRVSVGVDAAVLPSLGVTVGYETGANAGEGEAGATGGLFGVGVSYALYHARRGEPKKP